MSLDWCPGIREACEHWRDAMMLQHTFKALEENLQNQSDATIDAAKGLVECVCRLIVEELDNPELSLKPKKNNATITDWVAAATRVMKLGDNRDRKFADIISCHNQLAATLRELRNEAGPLSHGKDGYIQVLTTYHHRAAVLSADAIITFLHRAYMESEVDLVRTREPYERFDRFHRLIDAQVSLQTTTDDEGNLAVDIVLPSGDIIPLRIEASRFLYQLDREAYVEALNATRNVFIQDNNVDEVEAKQ